MSISKRVWKKATRCPEWKRDPFSDNVGCRIRGFVKLPCEGFMCGGSCDPMQWLVEGDEIDEQD